MIFLDTSAIYVLADRGDPNHGEAVTALRRLLEDGENILLHSYILMEAAALLQRRLGLRSALQFLQESQGFHIHWVSSGDHEEAVGLLEEWQAWPQPGRLRQLRYYAPPPGQPRAGI